MSNYKMEVFPQTAEDGSTYWTAKYPRISGCIGCGNTAEEAIAEAQENLEVYLEYLLAEGIKPPIEDTQKQCPSGKIALRVSKSTHKQLLELAASENVSLNSILNKAIERYLGYVEYGCGVEKKIDTIQSLTEDSISLQQFTSKYVQKMWSNSTNYKDLRVGVNDE